MRKLITILFLICTLSGFATEKWFSYRIAEGVSPKNDIRSICLDKQKNIWVGTWTGVFELKDNNWISRGLNQCYVQTLFIDRNGRKWAGMWNGGLTVMIDNQNWKRLNESSPSGSINVINEDNAGNIWAGDWDHGVVCIDRQGKIAIYNLLDDSVSLKYKPNATTPGSQVKIGDNSILSINCDRSGNLWFGSYHGLSLFDHKKWTLFNRENSKLPDNDIYALASDKNGTLWVGTCNGLVRKIGTQWIIYNTRNSGLTTNLILALATDNNGNVWVGTDKGVFCFNGAQWKNYTVENSELIDNRVQTITIFQNRIYLGTGDGMSVLEK